MDGRSGALNSVVSTENGRSFLLLNEASLGHDLDHLNEGYVRRVLTAARPRAREPKAIGRYHSSSQTLRNLSSNKTNKFHVSPLRGTSVMITTFACSQARRRLRRLLALVSLGHSFVITKNGREVCRLMAEAE